MYRFDKECFKCALGVSRGTCYSHQSTVVVTGYIGFLSSTVNCMFSLPVDVENRVDKY